MRVTPNIYISLLLTDEELTHTRRRDTHTHRAQTHTLYTQSTFDIRRARARTVFVSVQLSLRRETETVHDELKEI